MPSSATHASRVLLTGGRAPATLELARLFRRAGRDVGVADSWPVTVAGLSRAVSARFLVPSPRFAYQAFEARLSDVARTFLPDVLIPTCEEVFWVARASERLEPFTRVFSPTLEALRELHDKGAFARLAERLALRVPPTQVLTSAADLDAVRGDAERLVFKPAFSRFGTRTLIRPSASALRHVTPSERAPWVAQAFVPGREVCAYGVAVRGRLRALAVYESRFRAGRASVVFEAERNDAVRTWVQAFVERAGAHGQLAFDFMQDGRGAVWALECNPRLTSGVHLLRDVEGFAGVFLEADGPLLEPRPGARSALKAAMLGGAVWQRGGASAFVRSRDVLFELPDPLPALAQPLLTAQIAWRAVRSGTSLLGATTHDIQWDGEG